MKQKFKVLYDFTKNNIIQCLATALILLLVAFSIYRVDSTLITLSLILTIVIIWNFETILEITVSTTGISLKRREEKLDSLTNEAENLIKYINNSIDPIIEYNLAQLRTDGTFDETVGFPFAMKFIGSVKEMAIKQGEPSKYDYQFKRLTTTIIFNFIDFAEFLSSKFKEFRNSDEGREFFNELLNSNYDKIKPFEVQSEKLIDLDPDNKDYVQCVNSLKIFFNLENIKENNKEQVLQ